MISDTSVGAAAAAAAAARQAVGRSSALPLAAAQAGSGLVRHDPYRSRWSIERTLVRPSVRVGACSHRQL